jgi:hypothetical protein
MREQAFSQLENISSRAKRFLSNGRKYVQKAMFISTLALGGCDIAVSENKRPNCRENELYYEPIGECVECIKDSDCEISEFCEEYSCEPAVFEPIGNFINVSQENFKEISEDSISLLDGKGIEPGVILIGEDNQGLPFLRRVESVEVSWPSTVIHTSQASLTEAYEHANFSFGDKVIFPEQAKAIDYKITQGFNLINHGGLEIGGSVDFDFSPIIDGGISIRNRRLDRFEMNISGNLEIDLELYANINGQSEFSNEIPIGSFLGPPIVGPGIYIQPELSLLAGVELLTDKNGFANFLSRQNLNVGVTLEYKENSWSVAQNASASLLEKLVEFKVPGEIRFKGYIRPELSFELFNFVGPTLALVPYLELASVLNNQTPEFDVDWALKLGMDGTVGVKAEILDKTLLDKELTLPFDLSTTVANGTYVISDCLQNNNKQCDSDSVCSFNVAFNTDENNSRLAEVSSDNSIINVWGTSNENGTISSVEAIRNYLGSDEIFFMVDSERPSLVHNSEGFGFSVESYSTHSANVNFFLPNGDSRKISLPYSTPPLKLIPLSNKIDDTCDNLEKLMSRICTPINTAKAFIDSTDGMLSCASSNEIPCLSVVQFKDSVGFISEEYCKKSDYCDSTCTESVSLPLLLSDSLPSFLPPIDEGFGDPFCDISSGPIKNNELSVTGHPDGIYSNLQKAYSSGFYTLSCEFDNRISDGPGPDLRIHGLYTLHNGEPAFEIVLNNSTIIDLSYDELVLNTVSGSIEFGRGSSIIDINLSDYLPDFKDNFYSLETRFTLFSTINGRTCRHGLCSNNYSSAFVDAIEVLNGP